MASHSTWRAQAHVMQAAADISSIIASERKKKAKTNANKMAALALIFNPNMAVAASHSAATDSTESSAPDWLRASESAAESAPNPKSELDSFLRLRIRRTSRTASIANHASMPSSRRTRSARGTCGQYAGHSPSGGHAPSVQEMMLVLASASFPTVGSVTDEKAVFCQQAARPRISEESSAEGAVLIRTA